MNFEKSSYANDLPQKDVAIIIILFLVIVLA